MMQISVRSTVAALALAAAAAGQAPAQEAVFGNDEDAEYATLIWQAMEALRLAGDDMIYALPYEGVEPHGLMLETFFARAEIEGHEGDLVVKRNYGPAGVSAAEVQADPESHLAAYTVMFRREAGYDADNKDWFWVKYLPDGSLDKNPAGMRLAGRVAKGADQGCIACHAGEDDYLFTKDVQTME